MTATQASERIGESPTTCSFHLRQLAKYGLVEEAGGGRGRARPWRLTGTGSWSGTGRGCSPLASYPRRWREAADDSAYILFLTVEELEQLNKDLSAMLMPLFRERLADPSKRPAGSVPVELLAGRADRERRRRRRERALRPVGQRRATGNRRRRAA
jgi:hypothetical protein